MLFPKQTKYKKYQKGRLSSQLEVRCNTLHFGDIGLQALERGRITARQIEALRRTLTGLMKRKGKVWIRVFPDTPITKKPSEVRMGKGKGNISYWICKIRPGKILYEVSGNNPLIIKNALEVASKKLGLKTRIITRNNQDL